MKVIRRPLSEVFEGVKVDEGRRGRPETSLKAAFLVKSLGRWCFEADFGRTPPTV
jgi:hypothetical protein